MTERVRDERLIEDLIEAAEWRGHRSQAGYMAGDLAAAQDDKEVSDARAALLTELQSLRSAASVGVKGLEAIERYEQFTDGWGDEVLGLKQHPKGDYVKFSDVAALSALPETEGVGEPVAWPDRCPTCDLIWSHHPPAIISGSESVRCIECKSVYTSPNPSSVSVADGWDEPARDQARGMAKSLLKSKGWKPGDNFHYPAMLGLMVEFAEHAHQVTDRCGWPDCGCDFDAKCGDAPMLSAAPQPPQPVKVDSKLFDQVAKLEEACNQARLALSGMVSPQSALDLLDARPTGVSAALTAALAHEGEAK